MAFPAWIGALGALASGFQQKREQQQRQQMIQQLLGQRTQQHPGGLGSQPNQMMGPQPSWGANNTTQGGNVYDQWGNPIGPSANAGINPSSDPATAASPAATTPSPVPLPTPNPSPSAQGATAGSAPVPNAFNDPTGAGASPVPYLNSPYGAGYTGPNAPADDPIAALFSGFAGV